MNLYIGLIGIRDTRTDVSGKVEVILEANTVAEFKTKAFKKVRESYPAYVIDERKGYSTALRDERKIGNVFFRVYLTSQ